MTATDAWRERDHQLDLAERRQELRDRHAPLTEPAPPQPEPLFTHAEIAAIEEEQARYWREFNPAARYHRSWDRVKESLKS